MTLRRDMSSETARFAIVLACAASFGVTGAWAQVLPDLELSASQSQRLTDEQLKAIEASQAQAQSSDEVDGEAGVYVLRKQDIFTLSVDAGVGYSSNPSHTFDDAEDSGYSRIDLRAAVDTVIAGSMNAGASMTLGGVDYVDASEQSSRAATLAGYAGRSVLNDRVFVSLGLSAGTVADDHYENSVSFVGAGLTASTAFAVRPNLSVQPVVGVLRQEADTSELSSTFYIAGVRAVWAPRPRLRIAPAVRYTRRAFDDFYEDVTFIERNDDVYDAEITASYRVRERLAVNVSLGYTTQNSSFLVADYDETNVTPSVSLSYRF